MPMRNAECGMRNVAKAWPIVIVMLSGAAASAEVKSSSPGGLRFTKKLLTVDANEGCDVADVNRDGKLDIIAGRNWYAGPDFTPRPLRLIEDWNGYVQSNADHVYDVNGDGWPDVIAGSFLPSEVHWYENPGEDLLNRGFMWKQHLLADTKATTNEAMFFRDLDGDSVPEWCVNSWTTKAPTLVWKIVNDDKGAATLKRVTIGEQWNGHGMGFGDLNGDGREDILVGSGWYERPEGEPFNSPWTFHKDWEWHASCPMLVVDVDEDGRNDIIVGEGHNYGLYWVKQLPPGERGKVRWAERNLIDRTWSQPHAMHLADLDGDGNAELITGKRVYAHNGGDPGGKDPPCLYYYKWNKAGEFTRFTIDEGAVGTGLQIRTADLNGDGRIDIVVAGKSGTYVLLNDGK